MRRLLRSTSVLLILTMLIAAAAWTFLATRSSATPTPLPVADDDVEVAWLYHATAAAVWQRFVQAASEVPDAKLDADAAFPRLTTAVPEIALKRPGRGWLRIRWYKLTSDWNVEYWTRELLKRDPPPLAIIGGSNTSLAIEQAERLRDAAASLSSARRPLLLLTQATADQVRFDVGTEGVPLVEIYDQRTFRFCFTNRQMARAVTSYIWSKPDELRPDSFPVYTAVWEDDFYSRDLTGAFLDSLRPYLLGSVAAAELSSRGLLVGATGGFPLSPLLHENVNALDAHLPHASRIPWSTGGFDRPNPFEAEAAEEILNTQRRHQRQRRALLVLSGQSGPSRRLVRALCRQSPIRSRSFVLAAGDTLSMNAVRRDRNITWPIQDLPCSLVFFCHHNPVGAVKSPQPQDSARGTEDVFLFKDIVQALTLADGPLTAAALADHLRRLRVDGDELSRDGDGPLLFDADGNRRSGTGEHVVWLRPESVGERMQPLATLTVAAWQLGRPEPWLRRGEPQTLRYTGASDSDIPGTEE